MLDSACAQAAVWRQSIPDLRIAVNLFGAQFRTGELAEKVVATLDRHKLDPRGLELEVTENIILHHDEEMLAPLRRLRDMGVGIAFDDFGTGYASLSMLKRYPLTRLKIDRTFVEDICDDRSDAAIVNAMVYLGRALHIEVIAEGVETLHQLDFLRTCGCDLVQGYYFGEPMPAAEFARRQLYPRAA